MFFNKHKPLVMTHQIMCKNQNALKTPLEHTQKCLQNIMAQEQTSHLNFCFTQKKMVTILKCLLFWGCCFPHRKPLHKVAGFWPLDLCFFLSKILNSTDLQLSKCGLFSHKHLFLHICYRSIKYASHWWQNVYKVKGFSSTLSLHRD